MRREPYLFKYVWIQRHAELEHSPLDLLLERGEESLRLPVELNGHAALEGRAGGRVALLGGLLAERARRGAAERREHLLHEQPELVDRAPDEPLRLAPVRDEPVRFEPGLESGECLLLRYLRASRLNKAQCSTDRIKNLIVKVGVQSRSGYSLDKAAFRRGDSAPRSDDEAEHGPVSQPDHQPANNAV